MPLTRDFKETVKARAERDPEFRRALIAEAIECLLDNDFETAKSILRGYINATMGFDELAREVGTPPKRLMRMLGPRGNPQARSLPPVIAHIRRREKAAA
jgi:DNA-binding phage protein